MGVLFLLHASQVFAKQTLSIARSLGSEAVLQVSETVLVIFKRPGPSGVNRAKRLGGQ